MRKIIVLSILFMLNQSLATELKIAVSDTNLGGVNQSHLKSILSCTTGILEENITIKSFPSLRGRQEFLNRTVDGYYPVVFTSELKNNGLFPLYIDEVLMIKLKDIPDKNISLGLVKGDHSQYLKKFKDYTLSFSVLNSKTLFRGLVEKRAEAIIVKRSEIPNDFLLDNFDLKSLEYVESGIELNTSFYKKAAMGKIEVRKRYSECLEKVNFLLDHDRRESIVNKIRKDIEHIQSIFTIERKNVSNIAKKEKMWKDGSRGLDFIQKILKSEESIKLKEVLSGYNFVSEAFIFNHQGATLGETIKSSDFDQSDERKYSLVKSQKEFNENNITDLYYDASSGVFQIGIMIRLQDRKGDFSGGIYIGANINKILTHYKIN
ncbi:putative exported protein [Halobacteriovorax marinus SJ]|uniref:Exported protein n=2 Tax=Halobacteriovorax marinus TaxID=97084 RepID=E1WYA9_HALMS|nr:putative exported protein [Halobacteriovorax marinus SJ]